MPPDRILPQIRIFDRSRSGLPLPALRAASQRALLLVLALRRFDGDALAALDAIEVSLVDDSTMARLHEEFLHIPGPTDVLSFDHGEILVSVDTAAEQAPLHGNSLEDEVLLYILHGLLHLAGYDDADAGSAETMAALQEQLMAQLR
ncbi:MAG TPA: rRNA maturation RNase YbeY [Verrucomicrobiales bacterium]|nr:rRNA maturation RNase YbeY [Verrucomicrobiales bacterium]